MKYNVIETDESINKLYEEVMSLTHAQIRNMMEHEAWENGMRVNTLDYDSQFHFIDGDNFDMVMQNTFRFLGRNYIFNIVLAYRGKYYIPLTPLAQQYQVCWDYAITSCLLPVFVETDETAGLTVNNIPSYSWTINRRELSDLCENDNLGETLRIDIPEKIFPNLIMHPLCVNHQFDPIDPNLFDADIVHLNYNKPLTEIEIAMETINDDVDDATKVNAYFALGQHATECACPNKSYICKRFEQAASFNSLQAAMILVYYYYYGVYGVEKNYDKAVRYIQQIMSINDPNLVGYEVLYAECYRYGRGVEQNIDKAIEIFTSLMPNPWAYFNLAYIYATGENVKVDMAKASEYLSLAKQNGLLEDLEKSFDEATRSDYPELIDNYNDVIKDLEHLTKILTDNGDTEAIKGLETISQFYVTQQKTEE